jgi:hypothetical protein
MGILSAIAAPFKAIAKVSKNIFSGVKKAWKSVTGSTLGKALLIGAAIYFGYLAFQPGGAFAGSAVSPATGELAAAGAGTGTAAAEAGTALTANEAAIAETMTAGGAAGGAGAGTTAGTGAGAGVGAGTGEAALTETGTGAGGWGSGSGNLMTSPGGMSINAAPTVPGVTSGAAPASWWASQPGLAQYGLIQAGAGAIQGAFQPNAIDIENERARLEREETERRYQLAQSNLAVGPVNLGFRPAVRPVVPGQPPRPTGILNYR